MNAQLVVLFVTAFVDTMGLVLVIPLLPFYAERMGASSAAIGILIGAFSAAQLVSAPFWGKLSDHYGRRPLLLIGLGASVAAYVVFAFAGNFWMLLASRVVQGLGGGTVAVVQAYVTDVTPPNDRAKTLGWLSAATSLGAVFGPGVGSLLAQAFGHTAPGLGAALLSFVNMVFAWQYLRESYELRTSMTGADRGPGTREALWQVLRTPGSAASRLIWTYTIAIGAFYGMPAVFAQLLERRFDVTERTIGYFFMWFGAMGVISRILLLGPALRRLGEVRLSRLGLALMAVGMVIFPFAPNFPILGLACVLMPLGTAFTFPGVTALLSRVVPNESRGTYMGVQQAFGGVARTIFPWFDGVVFDTWGMASPFLVAALLCAGTIGLAIGLERSTEA